MINIGEISKPSTSESPVRPKRSSSDGELVEPAGDVESPAKVSNPLYKKGDNKKKDKKKKPKTPDNKTIEVHDNKLHDDDFYDETGHQDHHGEIDIKA